MSPVLSSAHEVARRAHVPYSGERVGVALGLASGRWVAAPRIESASFPLSIPALQGAWTLAVPTREAIVAAACTRPFADDELALIAALTGTDWTLDAPDQARSGAPPEWTTPLELRGDGQAPEDAAEGIRLALDAAQRAVVPASAFPVGAVLVDVGGQWVTGTNVEHVGDWTRGLCAERSALVAARTAGLDSPSRLYLACPKAPGATPCGGCRQLLAELAPDAEIVMWTGNENPLVTTPSDLLPGAFGGDRL